MAKSNLNSPNAKSRRPRSDQAERAAPLSNRPHRPAGERSETLRASKPAAWIRPERSDIFIFLILVVLTAAVYWPVRGFEFINYDDADYVSENVRVQAGLTIGNVGWAFRTMYFSNWHPLTWLSYMLDCQLFGLNAGAFHLVNALFHLLTSLLLFAVFKRMTGARWPSALAAALFAVHPLHVESVAWVAERKDVLSGFFCMLTLWAYVRYAERPRIWRYALALGFFALGLMAKPMLVTLPFVLFLLDFWPLGRVQPRLFETNLASQAKTGQSDSFAQCPPKPAWALVVEKVPFFLLTLLSSVLTYIAQHGARVAGENLPLGTRLANVLLSYLRYMANTICPSGLAAFYPYPSHWPAWEVGGAALVLIAITILVFRFLNQRPYWAVGWLWFLGTLVPVIGLVQVGGQSMADRYMYIPLIGLLIILAWSIGDLAVRRQVGRPALIAASVAMIVSCAALSARQVRFWQNSFVLFDHALKVTPGSGLAHNNLGDALLTLGKTNEALAHFSAALEVDAKDFTAYGNLGNVLFGQGKPEEAAAKYLEGWRLNPKSPELNHNLAFCLAAQGRFSESIPYYETALKFRSEYVEAYVNLGNALLAQRKFDDAISSYNEALRSRPNFLPAHFNLANALLQQGKHQQAATGYLETLRLQPDSAQAHNNLALALAGQGKNSEALAHLAEAVRLKPDEAQFHLRFASALLAESRTPEAILEYKEALRLEPAMVAALNDLAWVLATQEDAKLRNASEAVKYAERACDLTGRRQAFLLGTLAAAYAEAGRFPDAVTTAEKAAEVATSAGQKEIATTNQKLAELYRAGKTYRQAPTAQGQGQ